jgi:hypothetical protein
VGQFVFVAKGGGGSGPGTGDVVGPAGSNDGTIVLFDGITGTLIKDSGILPDPFVGDTGLGGQIGFVPAPAAGDAAAFKYLNSNGNWEQLNQDQILPGFSIASFAKTNPNPGTLLYLRGTALGAPTVGATYISGPPVSGLLANVLGGVAGVGNVDPLAWIFVAPFATGAQPANVLRNGTDGGADPTWTIDLTATGTAVDTASTTITWTRQIFFGVDVSAGPLSAVQVAALGGGMLDTGFVRTFVVSPTNEYVYYCYPASYGPINFMKLSGFDVDLQPVYTVAGVSSGISSTYNVYRTTNLLTGVNLNFVVT